MQLTFYLDTMRDKLLIENHSKKYALKAYEWS